MKRFITFLLIAAGVCCVVYIVNNYEEIFAKQSGSTVASANNKVVEQTPAITLAKAAPAKKTTNANKTNKAQSTHTPVKTKTPADSKHLSFKGVPIDGSLSTYIKAMQASGFTLIKSSNGIAQLRGDFAGHKGCLIKVSTLSNHDLVCTIDIVLTERDKWSTLYSDYSTLKTMLTQKYGIPSKCVEKFDGYYGGDDNSKMFAVEWNHYKYYSIFKTAKGDITLRIDNADLDCFVSLTYTDKINSAKVNETVMNDL